jgi:long-subunit fatty acid transport protein
MMKKASLTAAVFALSASTALAGGIERSTQSVGVLFEKGNHAEISFGFAKPSLDGKSRTLAPAPGFTGGNISNVANDFVQPSAAVKLDVNEKISVAAIFDRPFGADVEYDDSDNILGGTKASATTTSLTILGKYKLNDNFSVYGGLRSQRAEGEISLRGAAYGATSGYDIELESGSATGYVVGAAYEKPEIALRVALTYNSAIEHELDTTESGPLIDPDGPGPAPSLPLLNGTSETKIKTPESLMLEFQSGIAENTLLFGSIRHVKHSQFKVDPKQFVTVTGGGLIDLEAPTTYRLGVGRRFNEKLAGSVGIAYEAAGDELVSPLAPSSGSTQINIGASYNLTESLTLSGGASYTKLGDAKPQTADTARADFDGNSATAFGFKIAYKF